DRRLPARGDGLPGSEAGARRHGCGTLHAGGARHAGAVAPVARGVERQAYAFLDDAPLEERRTQAVITRRGLDVKTADELGTLDRDAIDRVKDEAWPEVTSADELHDALLVIGAVPSAECGVRNAEWQGHFDELAGQRPAG